MTSKRSKMPLDTSARPVVTRLPLPLDREIAFILKTHVQPIDEAAYSLRMMSVVMERDWTRDGTSDEQDSRFKRAAQHLKDAAALLEQNSNEFKAEESIPRNTKCNVCQRTDAHTHCPECGSTEHVAADCDMEG